MRPTEHVPGAWRGVWILFFVWVMAMLDRYVLLLLLPGIKTSMALSDTEVSLIYGLAFAVCFGIAGLPLGHLADRRNRRNMLLLGAAGWSVATIASGFADTFAVLFAARMIVGISQAVLAPATFSIIADMFPASGRGKPTAVLLAAATLGAALANFTGGALLDHFSRNALPVLPYAGEVAAWQVTMLVVGCVSVLAVPALALVREPARGTAATAAPGATATSAHMATHFRRYAVMFALLFTTFGIFSASTNGLGAWYPVLFMRSGGLSASQTGIVLGTLALACAAASALLGGWLSDWSARRDPVAGRLKLVIACFAGQSLVLLSLLFVHFLPSLVTGLALFSILSSIAAAASYSLLPDLAPPEGRGLLIAVYQLIGNVVGFGFGPTIVALATNEVLRDEGRLADAMLMVATPSLIVAGLCACAAIPRMRTMRAAAG